jgi:hypothetical protein
MDTVVECFDTCTVPDVTQYLIPSFQVAHPILASTTAYKEDDPLSKTVDSKFAGTVIYRPDKLYPGTVLVTQPSLNRYTAANQTTNETLTFDNVVTRGDWSSADPLQVNDATPLELLKQQIEVSEKLDDRISMAIGILMRCIDALLDNRGTDRRLIRSIKRFADDWKSLEEKRKETWDKLRKKLVDEHLSDLIPFSQFGTLTLIDILSIYQEVYADGIFDDPDEYEEERKQSPVSQIASPKPISPEKKTPLQQPDTKPNKLDAKSRKAPEKGHYTRKNPFTVMHTM